MSAIRVSEPLSIPTPDAEVLRYPSQDLCRVVSDLAQLDGLARYWPTADNAGAIARFAWARPCAVAFAGVGDLHVLAVLRGHEVRALAPAAKRRLLGFRRIVLLGVDELSEPTDLLFRDEEALHRLVGRAVDEKLPLCLDRLPENSPTVAALEKACAG